MYDGSHHDRAALAARLSGGDRRSVGAADEIAAETLGDASLAPLLVDLMRHADPIVRMRAADALEKASRQIPCLIAPHADALITRIGPIAQQEVRWHVAQMIPRLPLTARQHADAVGLLRGYVQDQSRIVVVEALTALTALAQDDAALRTWLIPELRASAAHGPPSARSRSRKLLAELQRRAGSEIG
jgi:hypothetical protein